MRWGKGQSFKLVVFMVFLSVLLIVTDIVTQAIGMKLDFERIYTFTGGSLFLGLANYFGRSYVETHSNHDNSSDAR